MIGVFAIVFNNSKQVLVGKRKSGYKAGYYGFPGGRVELNEPIFTTINRELEEETGMRKLDFSFVGVVRENQGEHDFVHFAFAAIAINQQPQLCEPDKCEQWEWRTVTAELLSKLLPGHQAGLKLYESGEQMLDLTG